jgi:hypothetical protein
MYQPCGVSFWPEQKAAQTACMLKTLEKSCLISNVNKKEIYLGQHLKNIIIELRYGKFYFLSISKFYNWINNKLLIINNYNKCIVNI